MNDEHKKKRKFKIYIWSSISLVYIMICFTLLYPTNALIISTYLKTYILKDFHWTRANVPLTKVDLDDYKPQKGETIKLFNYEFVEPFGKPVKTEKVNDLRNITYKGGTHILAWKPMNLDIRAWSDEVNDKPILLTVKDYYDYMKQIEEYRLGDLEIFGNIKQNLKVFGLLSLKSTHLLSQKTEYFENDYNRGLIYFDTNVTTIEIYDAYDNNYQLCIKGASAETIYSIANSFRVNKFKVYENILK